MQVLDLLGAGKKIFSRTSSFQGLIDVEASIVGTSENGIYYQNPASKLIDGLGLDGTWGSGCATTEGSGVQWFSLELNGSQIVTKVQIARRMDYTASQGRNVRITVGSSREYDPNEPMCRPEIFDLQLMHGLVDYVCTKEVAGKYVKLSSSREIHLTICEVKVFKGR